MTQILTLSANGHALAPPPRAVLHRHHLHHALPPARIVAAPAPEAVLLVHVAPRRPALPQPLRLVARGWGLRRVGPPDVGGGGEAQEDADPYVLCYGAFLVALSGKFGAGEGASLCIQSVPVPAVP